MSSTMSTEPPATSAAEPNVEPLDERGRCSVRFDTQCVVIPDPAHRPRMPRVTTKSYSLPLWKRRSSYSGPSSSSSLAPEDPSAEENHLVLRVPLPTLSLKPQSPRCTDHAPLTPCLVHRTPSSPPGSNITRSPSLTRRAPRKTSPSPSRSDIVTVPLRPCCPGCEVAAEAALADGDAWPEHFSRAASRRRSLSADSGPRTVMGSAAAAFYGGLGHPIAINVDEVDKRRRSSDSGPSRPSQELVWLNDAAAIEERTLPSLHVSRNGVSNSSADSRSPPSPTRLTPSTPRIPEEDDEEDEDELFPLPSPRRTPTTSPSPSPAGSLSSLTVPQTNQNATNSPTPSNGSSDSTKAQLLAPPAASSSSLSLPKTSESTTDLTSNEEVPRSPSPNLLSSLPSISGRVLSRSPSPRISRTPPTPTELSPTEPENELSQIPRLPSPIPIPSSGSRLQLRVPSSPQLSPTQSRFPWRSKRSVSTDASIPSSSPSSFSPSTSPSTSPNTKKRSSFAMAGPRHLLADVIRGVGAMGSGSGTVGIGIGR